MKVARIHRYGGPEVISVEEIDQPECGPQDLLIRQYGTSINHRDIWLRTGLQGSDNAFELDLPAILGIDVAGEVVEVGKDVKKFSPGDRIVANPYIPCGECFGCRRNRPYHCANIGQANGAYAEFVKVPEQRAISLGVDVPEEKAACFANTYITAWEMLFGKARITPDDVVFVWAGTSGLGSAVIDIANIVGCSIITTAGKPEKLAVLRNHGVADLVLDHYRDDVVASVHEFTEGVGATVVIEHVGAATWTRSLELAAAGARIVSAGLTSGRILEMDVVTMIMKQFSITGSVMGCMRSARAAVKQLNAGRLNPLIGERIAMSNIVQAHELMDSGEVIGKIFIDVNA